MSSSSMEDNRQRPFARAVKSGKDSKAKDYAVRFMKLVRAEFKLPKEHIETMCEEFEALPLSKFPKVVGGYGTTGLVDKRVLISENEYGIFKYIDGEDIEVKYIVKEICIYHYLKELQGIKIPKLLSYGVPDADGSPGFFLLAECYGHVLKPDQVSAGELGELLNDIHAHGILLTGHKFPSVMRHGSSLVLVDLSNVVFDKSEQHQKEEFNFFLSLCKKL